MGLGNQPGNVGEEPAMILTFTRRAVKAHLEKQFSFQFLFDCGLSTNAQKEITATT